MHLETAMGQCEPEPDKTFKNYFLVNIKAISNPKTRKKFCTKKKSYILAWLYVNCVTQKKIFFLLLTKNAFTYI